MDIIRNYLLTITAAAIIYAIVMLLTDKKSIYHTMSKIICGMFMTIAVLSPILNIRIQDINWRSRGFFQEGQDIALNAQEDFRHELTEGIITQTQTYILTKADTLHANITAQVQLSEESSIPWSVKLSGEISPYGKQLLTQYISQDLGIPEERQIWI